MSNFGEASAVSKSQEAAGIDLLIEAFNSDVRPPRSVPMPLLLEWICNCMDCHPEGVCMRIRLY